MKVLCAMCHQPDPCGNPNCSIPVPAGRVHNRESLHARVADVIRRSMVADAEHLVRLLETEASEWRLLVQSIVSSGDLGLDLRADALRILNDAAPRRLRHVIEATACGVLAPLPGAARCERAHGHEGRHESGVGEERPSWE